MTGEQLGGGFVAVVTGVLCLVLAFEALRRCILRLRGVSTTAELVRFRTAVAEDGDLLYYPVVAFTLPNGVEIEAEGEGVSHPPHGTHEGDRTEVVYDPAVPTSIVLPSLLPGRLKVGEILAHCVAAIALGFLTYQILVDTF
ncbi:DUF3592 domain-containing protein [Streptomyces sp. NPDC086766]|uniref:DUF3592 domain-containing protein n=1 Tax=Streptomyces sp. NPDC086766 TaxID=3365754 RepID=UPI0038200A73